MQNNKNINPLLRSMKTIKKSDIILFIMDFLYNEHLDKALISLEQETNISLFNYPKELLVLRNLILEGNWNESEEIINSINQNNINNFPYRKAIFELKKQQFLEAVESEPNQSSNGGDVENLVAQCKHYVLRMSSKKYCNACHKHLQSLIRKNIKIGRRLLDG